MNFLIQHTSTTNLASHKKKNKNRNNKKKILIIFNKSIHLNPNSIIKKIKGSFSFRISSPSILVWCFFIYHSEKKTMQEQIQHENNVTLISDII